MALAAVIPSGPKRDGTAHHMRTVNVLGHWRSTLISGGSPLNRDETLVCTNLLHLVTKLWGLAKTCPLSGPQFPH